MVDQAAGMANYKQHYGALFEFGGLILVAPTAANRGETFDELPTRVGTTIFTDVAEDSILDVDRRTKFLCSAPGLDLVRYCNMSDGSVSDLQTRLLPGRVFGYVMRNRKWFVLNVDLLKDVVDLSANRMLFRTRYEDLVLPRGHKKLLQALIAHYTGDKGSGSSSRIDATLAMDVVHGKGEGLIILLHGPPGVGKTSTAECVAAQLKRPLLPITCGDLGTFPTQIESKLDEFCMLAYKWRCVLLLDEADVFLSKREKGNAERNATVGGLKPSLL
jgi:hypothetical protein